MTVPSNREAADLYLEIDWTKALTAVWSLVWRLLISGLIVSTAASLPLVAMAYLFGIDSVRHPSNTGLATQLFWQTTSLISLASIPLGVWCMRRTLERHTPGLIWRVSWMDASRATFYMYFRCAAVGGLAILFWYGMKGQVPPHWNSWSWLPWSVPPLLTWAMRATLRGQFLRSLSQRRIQGATGILTETTPPSQIVGWGRTFLALWSIWWRASLLATTPFALWTAGCYLLFLALGLNPRPGTSEPFELAAFVILSLIGIAVWFWLTAWATRRGIEVNMPGLKGRLSWADVRYTLRDWLWRLVLVHNGVFLLLWLCFANFLDSPELILGWMAISALGAAWAFRAALRIQFIEMLNRGLVRTPD